jgi:hypothetical protein
MAASGGFFNEVAGGPENGRSLLVDANVDWGQDLIFLERLLAEREIDEVYLGYFGTALPEAYGLRYRPIPGFIRFTAGAEIDAYNPYTPPPGWYALSATSLQLGLMLQNTDIYAYFQDKEPVACAGYSICLYHVAYPEEWPVDRVVVADGRSVSDIPPGELGVADGRRLIAKWVQAPGDIYPLGEGFSPPEGFQAVGADFSGAFTLLGYVGETAVVPGQPLPLTLYWQVGSGQVAAPRPSQAAPLAAFVHLSGADPWPKFSPSMMAGPPPSAAWSRVILSSSPSPSSRPPTPAGQLLSARRPLLAAIRSTAAPGWRGRCGGDWRGGDWRFWGLESGDWRRQQQAGHLVACSPFAKRFYSAANSCIMRTNGG